VVRRETSVHAEQLYEIKIMTTVHLVGFNCDSYTSSSPPPPPPPPQEE
jgi:hypothetical protein